MKKLLIAMTAAAVGFGAWADGEPMLLNENFDNWANGTGENDIALEYMTALPQGLWSYSGNIGAEELKVVPQVGNDKALTLNTGSKVLNAKFATSALTIPENTGYIFTSTVNFSDPSDTLPTLADGDKFALVVLDNVESLTTEGMHDDAKDKPATNLWVIAGHGSAEGTRAYLMQPYTEGDGNLSDDFFNRDHTITIKAYNNVMGSGMVSNSGFLLKVDDVICTVLRSYKIENNVINLTVYDGVNANYLGYSANEVALPVRYSKGQLLISRSADSTLTSVDFQGQGTIDDVSLATTGSDEIFGPDASTLNFVNYGSDGIVSIEFGETPVENGKYTITQDVGSSLTFTVTVENNYELKATGATVSDPEDNVYTLTYTVTDAPSQTITLNAFLPAATVNGESVSADDFVSKVNNIMSGNLEIILKDHVTCTSEPLMVNMGVIARIDLAGKTITGEGEIPAVQNGGTLTIVDSSVNKTGTVNGQVINNGTLILQGGSYNKESNTTDGVFTYFDIVDKSAYIVDDKAFDGYWTVTEKPAITTYEVTYAPGNFIITKGDDANAFESGTKLASGTYTFKVVAAEGYKVDSVMVDAQRVTVNNDGTFVVEVTNKPVNIMVDVRENAFMVTCTTMFATITLGDAAFKTGTKLESGTYTFKVKADTGYMVSIVRVDGLEVMVDNEGAFEVVVTKPVTIMVETERVPLQPLPGTATDADVPLALGRQADMDVTANITTVADYTAFQAWAEKVDGGTSAVAGSKNAYAAYVLDAAGLLTEADKLADADIKVKAFAQDATAQTAGTFALEIKIKDCEIGPNAIAAKLEKLIVAEGTSELGNNLNPFNKDNVTTTVDVEGGKAKFKVNAKAKDDNITKFFFKMKFNK